MPTTPSNPQLDSLNRNGLAVLANHGDEPSESFTGGPPWKVNGVAITENAVTFGGAHVERFWPESTLRAAAERQLLTGQPIVKNFHDLEGQAPADDVIGKVTNEAYIDGVGLAYEGEISDEGIAQKVANGYLDVSPVPHIARERYDGENDIHVVEEIQKFRDIAVVAEGAVPNNEIQIGSNPAVSALSLETLSNAFGPQPTSQSPPVDAYAPSDALRRSEARTPSYTGTASQSDRAWPDGGPSLGAYIDGYYEHGTDANPDERPSQWADLPQDARDWIAAKTLLGDSSAETAEDGIAYPVVFPNGDLSEDALLSARSLAGHAGGAADSIRSITATLLENEFGTDVDTNATPALRPQSLGDILNGDPDSDADGDDDSRDRPYLSGDDYKAKFNATDLSGSWGELVTDQEAVYDTIHRIMYWIVAHDLEMRGEGGPETLPDDPYLSSDEYTAHFDEYGLPDGDWGRLVRLWYGIHSVYHEVMYYTLSHHEEMHGPVADGSTDEMTDPTGNTTDDDDDDDDDADTYQLPDPRDTITQALHDSLADNDPANLRTVKDGAMTVNPETNPLAQEVLGLEGDDDDTTDVDMHTIAGQALGWTDDDEDDAPETVDIESDRIARESLGLPVDDGDDTDGEAARNALSRRVESQLDARHETDDWRSELRDDPAAADLIAGRDDDDTEVIDISDTDGDSLARHLLGIDDADDEADDEADVRAQFAHRIKSQLKETDADVEDLRDDPAVRELFGGELSDDIFAADDADTPDGSGRWHITQGMTSPEARGESPDGDRTVDPENDPVARGVLGLNTETETETETDTDADETETET